MTQGGIDAPAPDKMIQFRDALCGIDWSDIRTTIGVNNMYDKFNDLLNNQINIYFPEIKIKINEKSENKPWITRTILNSINKKNTMYKHYMKSKSPSLLEKYKKIYK